MHKKLVRFLVIVGIVFIIIGIVLGFIGSSLYYNSELKQKDKEITDLKASKEQMSLQNKNKGIIVDGQFLYNNKDIIQNASTLSILSMYISALKNANLMSNLQESGPFTVFIPTNSAFNNLPTTLQNLLDANNKTQLVNLLSYHIVQGRYLLSDLKDSETLTTLNGEKIYITKVQNNILVNNSKVQYQDITSSNGVIDIVDTVLLP